MVEPTDNELIALLAGKLDGGREAEISALLDSDPELQKRIELLSGSSNFADDFDTTGYDDRQQPIAGSYRDFLDNDGRLGKFEILEEVGRGGAGVVLKARDPELDRIVAIKWLNSAASLSDDARQRFQRESVAVAAIENPHVLPVFSVESIEGIPFLVSRFVDGVTLENRIGNLDVLEIIRVTKDVAEALQAAHDAGLIHRDVKPSNIMIENETDHVWLMDFGLVQAESSSFHTREGMLLGTPHYMSPEQAKGRLVDARTDLFSLGAVLFEMLSGRQPFSSDHISAVLWQVTEVEPPDLSKLAPQTPKWLLRLAQQLLEKNPGDRPRNATEVLKILDSHSTSFSKMKMVRRAALVGISGASIAVAAKFLFSERPEPPLLEGFKIAGRPEVFDSLSAAISETEDGGIIEIASNENLLINHFELEKSITIQAAEYFQPTLVLSEGDSIPAIRARADLILKNLTIRYISEAGRPGPLIRSSGENLTILHCRIEVPGRDWVGSRGLNPMIVFQGSGQVRIVHTALLSPFAAGLFFETDTLGERSIYLKNSIFFARNVLAVRAGNSNSVMNLKMEDCLANCRQIFTVGNVGAEAGDELPQMEFTVERSILDSLQSCFSVAPVIATSFFEKLDWVADKNRYAIRQKFVDARSISNVPNDLSEWRLATGVDEPLSESAPRPFVNSISSPPIDSVETVFTGAIVTELARAEYCRLDLSKIGPPK